jgi:hypothetical protein
MALSDITDSTAVLQAAKEFDALGREAFLAHYGFGKAREYFIGQGQKPRSHGTCVNLGCSRAGGDHIR